MEIVAESSVLPVPLSSKAPVDTDINFLMDIDEGINNDDDTSKNQ